jgi:hypothetical protein
MITNWTILFKEPSKLPEVRFGRKANGSANSDLGARHNYYSQYIHIIRQLHSLQRQKEKELSDWVRCSVRIGRKSAQDP